MELTEESKFYFTKLLLFAFPNLFSFFSFAIYRYPFPFKGGTYKLSLHDEFNSF